MCDAKKVWNYWQQHARWERNRMVVTTIIVFLFGLQSDVVAQFPSPRIILLGSTGKGIAKSSLTLTTMFFSVFVSAITAANQGLASQAWPTCFSAARMTSRLRTTSTAASASLLEREPRGWPGIPALRQEGLQREVINIKCSLVTCIGSGGMAMTRNLWQLLTPQALDEAKSIRRLTL